MPVTAGVTDDEGNRKEKKMRNRGERIARAKEAICVKEAKLRRTPESKRVRRSLDNARRRLALFTARDGGLERRS
jgi:hypothetical protein